MFNLNKIRQINVMRTLILVSFTAMILACVSQQEAVKTSGSGGESATINQTDSIVDLWANNQ